MLTQAIVITFEFKLEYNKQEFRAKKKHAIIIIISAAVTISEVN